MDRIQVTQRCPIAGCIEFYIPVQEYEQHMYSHYNYCKYGHYEEFEVGDPNWPKCMQEEESNDRS